MKQKLNGFLESIQIFQTYSQTNSLIFLFFRIVSHFLKTDNKIINSSQQKLNLTYAKHTITQPCPSKMYVKLSKHYIIYTLQLDIQGILGGGDLGAVINKATQDLIPSLLLNFEQQISEYLREFLLPRINPFLNNISLEDLANLMP